MEIVCLNFNPQSTILATGSMDHTAKVWGVCLGVEGLTHSTRPITHHSQSHMGGWLPSNSLLKQLQQGQLFMLHKEASGL